MKRDVRGHLAYRIYRDIDIVNCHPVIALQLFLKHGFACPVLAEYVLMRDVKLESIVNETGCSKSDAKDLMLAAANGGKVSSWAAKHGIDASSIPEWVFDFAREMTMNRVKLLKTEEYKQTLQIAVSEKKENPERSAFAWILQDWERRIMECCVIYAEHIDKFSVDVIIHDGWMVRVDGRVLAQDTLRRWADFAHEQTGIRISLDEKPMTAWDQLASLPSDAVKKQVADMLSRVSRIVSEYFDEIDPRNAAGIESDTYSEPHVKSLPDINRPTVVFDLAHMGTGKTEVAKLYVNGKQSIRVLAVSPRISHASEVSERIGLELYLNHRGSYWSIENMKFLSGFMTTVESVHYLEGAEPYDAVIIDEAEATINQIHSDTVKHVAGCWDVLSTVIRECKGLVYMADACLSKKTIETISGIVGDRPKLLRVNETQPYPRKFSILKTPNHNHSHVARDLFIKNIIRDIKRGLRVVVVSSSRKFADALLSIIKSDPAAWDPIKDAYRYYSSKSDDAMMQEDLKNIDAAWSPLAFLIYTPVLTVGNNFSKKGVFDKMYVYASPASVTGNDMLQSAFRVRYLNDTEVSVFIEPFHCEDLPVSSQAIHEAAEGQAQKYRDMIMEYAHGHASYKDRQWVSMYDEFNEKCVEPEIRLRAYENIMQKLKRRQHRLCGVANNTPESLVYDYKNFLRHVNMWRKHYAEMFKELVSRMQHEYEEIIVPVPQSSDNKKLDMDALEQDLMMAYFAFKPLDDGELARLQSLQMNKQASAEDKVSLEIHFFEYYMSLLGNMVSRELPNTQRARIFAKVFSDKRCSQVFAHILAESKPCEAVLS